MILLIIILSVLLIIAWILFAPLIMRVDTEVGDYSVRLPGIIKAGIRHKEDDIYMRARIFFVPFRIRPSSFARKKPRKRKPGKPRRAGSLKYGMMAGRELLASFRIKRLFANIDTSDFVLNSNLVPIFMYANNKRIHLNVNYMEEFTVYLDIRNRLANFLWTGIKYQYRMIVKP